MKNLLYLGIILMLASCGSNESENAAPNESKSITTNESEIAAPNESESITTNESESAASNESTVNMNGREVSTVKVGNLEVMTEDLVRVYKSGNVTSEMRWRTAMEACANLGDGWGLPTKDELNVLYENKDEIGGFSPGAYWSSTTAPHKKFVWTQHFQTGRLTEGGKRSSLKRNARAVKRLTKDRICEICDFKIKDDEKWEEMGEGYYWHMKCFEEQMQSGQ
ncbi:DUF1566 domain-containing protein [Crocinitomicaceae bacterium]|nr:DUF1566 domain-containing protein [Crocinitomicaceae bacterium]